MVNNPIGRLNTVHQKIEVSRFEENIFRLKEMEARLATLSCRRNQDGSLVMLYYFRKEDRLIVLELTITDNSVPSLYSTFTKADFIEREINNTFGVKFLGHPNLERIVGRKEKKSRLSFYEKKKDQNNPEESTRPQRDSKR